MATVQKKAIASKAREKTILSTRTTTTTTKNTTYIKVAPNEQKGRDCNVPFQGGSTQALSFFPRRRSSQTGHGLRKVLSLAQNKNKNKK